jgi:hypothetical protein
MKNFIMRYLVIIIVFATGCATNPYKVKEIDTKIESKGRVGDSTLGLNDKKEAILQEEVSASDELVIQENVNMKIQEDLENENFKLKECRMDLADPRLGGRGDIPAIPEVDNLKPADDIKEEMGLTDQGDLKITKKTYFVDKLKSSRKYETTLRKMVKVTKKYREECEFKMGIARRNAGLPSQRYQGEGFFQNGVWVQTKDNERTLDDGFRIRAQEKGKVQKAAPAKEVDTTTIVERNNDGTFTYKPMKVDEYGNIID